MSKNSFIFLLGIIVAILPATGFPNDWKTVFYVIIGITVSIVASLLRKEINSLRQALKGREYTVTDSFVQNSHIDTYGKTGKITSEGNSRHIVS